MSKVEPGWHMTFGDRVLPGEMQPSKVERSQIIQVGDLLVKEPARTADV